MEFDAYLEESLRVARATLDAGLQQPVEDAIGRISAALEARKAFLVCGNGGSACDSLHIAGELVARFMVERPGLKAIALNANPAVLTAWANDYDYESVFARQVEALGDPGGVLLGLSTSGNSANVVAAFHKARAMDITTIAMTGAGGGRLAELADVLIAVPSTSTPRIQEMHVVIYHYLCMRIEEMLAG